MKKRHLSWLLLATACMYGKPADEEEMRVEVPEAWATTLSQPGSGSAPLTEEQQQQWWRSFGDDKLDGFVLELLQNNRELGAAFQRIKMAQANATIAGAEQLPWAGAGASAGRQRNVLVGFPTPGGEPFKTTATSYGVSLDVSWEIDLWGRIEARKGAAQARLIATREDYLGVAYSLIAQTAKAWFTLREARAQVELAKETVESRQKSVDLVTERFRQARRQALDVHLARQQLARAKTNLSLREGLRTQARMQLELLLGRYPRGDVEAVEGLPPLPPMPESGIPSEILNRRPDLRVLRQDLLASRFEISQSRAELLPRISLSSSVGTTSNQLSDLVDGDFGTWNLFGNLVQPIFQGGRLLAQIDASEARYREALELYANRVLYAFGEVEAALTQAHWIDQQRINAEVVLRESQSALENSRLRYSDGTVGILELLQSERAVFDARSFLLDLQRQQLSARIDLHLALGGGFESVEVPPTRQNANQDDSQGAPGKAETTPEGESVSEPAKEQVQR